MDFAQINDDDDDDDDDVQEATVHDVA